MAVGQMLESAYSGYEYQFVGGEAVVSAFRLPLYPTVAGIQTLSTEVATIIPRPPKEE